MVGVALEGAGAFGGTVGERGMPWEDEPGDGCAEAAEGDAVEPAVLVAAIELVAFGEAVAGPVLEEVAKPANPNEERTNTIVTRATRLREVRDAGISAGHDS
jgi:hypothetical protein